MSDTVSTEDLTSVRHRIEALLSDNPPVTTPRRAFLEAQFEAGLAWVHFPPGLGGLGLARSLQGEVDAALAEAGAPDGASANRLGYSMGAAVLMAHGTPEQRERYLRAIFTGDERWCQLFSEPGAGSDLASVTTRAVRSGDGWIVTGQKVWNSLANISQVGMLLARTDWEVPKHQGLTYFLVDMSAPGVEVLPLRQMTGEAEFNEVYLTDVFVPDAQRVGDEGAGWRVATATLMNERSLFNRVRHERGPVDEALELYRERGVSSPELRSRMIDLWIKARVQRLGAARAAANAAAGTPGPEGSTGKLVYTHLLQEAYELCLDLLGDESMLYDSYAMTGYTQDDFDARHEQDLRRRFLRSRATTIEGGTSEILRNILAERVLGLPPEHRPDHGLPFSQRVRA